MNCLDLRMHRIPLHLAIPSIQWERNLPECILFEKTLNVLNVHEAQTMMKVLDEEAEFYHRQSYGIAEDLFCKAKNYFLINNSSSFAQGMFLISLVILRAPKDSSMLASALKLRGQLYFHECRFVNASNDFEMFLHVIECVKCEPIVDTCEVYGKLTLCMYMMGQIMKAKMYFRKYNTFKDCLPDDMLLKECIEKTDKFISRFLNELNDLDNDHQYLQVGIYSKARGKKCNGNIGHKGGIFAQCKYQKSEDIFVDIPIIYSINAPLLRCEVCLGQTMQHAYTCLNCRYKTYCSLDCMEKDSQEHAIECNGYKQLTLLMLDACSLFRIFTRIANALAEGIFKNENFHKNKTALDVWFGILESLKEDGIEEDKYLCVLKMEPMYNILTKTQYSTMIATAFRLAIFIDTNTYLLETYFSQLNISKKQKLIIVGSLLMRLHTNLLLNTFDCDIGEGNTANFQNLSDIEQIIRSDKSSGEKHDEIINDLNQFYNVDVNKDIWEYSQEVLKTTKDYTKMKPPLPKNRIEPQQCRRFNHLMSVYKDHLIEIYFNPEVVETVLYKSNAKNPVSEESLRKINTNLAQMSVVQRCFFVKRFARSFHNHYGQHFTIVDEIVKDINHILRVYSPTLSQFKHSCYPNVEILITNDGIVVGKALRTIESGEQLFVSFNNAHYMRNNCEERMLYLKQLGIVCLCKFCSGEEKLEPTILRNEIYCNSCTNVSVTSNMKKCPKCKKSFVTMRKKYLNDMRILETKLIHDLKNWNTNGIGERDIYILHTMMHLHARKYFGPQNDHRINIELKHARYLAYKNFIIQSYQLLMNIRTNILNVYEEHYIWFTYYTNMLQTIKILLIYNTENSKRINEKVVITLLQLCDFGIYIVKGQIDLLEFYETYDTNCKSILDDWKLLLMWKKIIVCRQVSTKQNIIKNYKMCKSQLEDPQLFSVL